MKKGMAIAGLALSMCFIAGCGKDTPDTANYLPNGANGYKYICTGEEDEVSDTTRSKMIIGLNDESSSTSYHIVYEIYKNDGSDLEVEDEQELLDGMQKELLCLDISGKYENGREYVICKKASLVETADEMKATLVDSGFTCN